VKCEGVNLFIHNNNGYVIVSVAWYKYRPLNLEFIVHYDWGFLIILYACLMSHAFYMTKLFTFLPCFFHNLPTWQYFVCQHICNIIYYIWAPKCTVDCSLSLRCSSNTVHTANAKLCLITLQFTSLPHIILVISGERYKLCRYSSCSFIHFPITIRHKILNTLNTTIPIFSLQSFLKVTHQVSYTRIYKKYLVNMYTFVSQNSRFQRAKQNIM